MNHGKTILNEWYMDGSRNIVGNQVRKARYGSKPVVTQEDLSARLAVLGVDIDRSTISRIEAGRRQVTDFELLALSRALGVAVDWLLGNGKDR